MISLHVLLCSLLKVKSSNFKIIYSIPALRQKVTTVYMNSVTSYSFHIIYHLLYVLKFMCISHYVNIKTVLARSLIKLQKLAMHQRAAKTCTISFVVQVLCVTARSKNKILIQQIILETKYI